MYKINKLQHGKRFVRDFHTRWWSIRNLTRSISDTSPTRVKIPYARAFHEVISISSIGIDTTWVNIGDIGDFGEFDKIGNFGDILPISSN